LRGEKNSRSPIVTFTQQSMARTTQIS